MTVPCGVAGSISALQAVQNASSGAISALKGITGLADNVKAAGEVLNGEAAAYTPQISKAILDGTISASTASKAANVLESLEKYGAKFGKFIGIAAIISDAHTLISDAGDPKTSNWKVAYDFGKLVVLDLAPLAFPEIKGAALGVSAVLGLAETIGHEDFSKALENVNQFNENYEAAKQALEQTGKWAPSVDNSQPITSDFDKANTDIQALDADIAANQNLSNDISADGPTLFDFLQNYDPSQQDGGYAPDILQQDIAELNTLLADTSAVGDEPDPNALAAQTVLDVAQMDDDVNAELYMPPSTMSPGGISAAAASTTMPVGMTLYAALEANDGTIQRFTFDPSSGISEFLEPSTLYTLTVFDPKTLSIGQVVFESAASGVPTRIPNVPLVPQTDFPAGGGLDALAAFVLGVNPANASNLVPGVTDLAALQAGLASAAFSAQQTGVIAALSLSGTAEAIVVESSTLSAGGATAYVATGNYGLAIVDVTAFESPTILGQVQLAGTATDVGVDSNLQLAAVADGTGGLQIINVADSSNPVVIESVPIDATAVQVFEGIAYANDGNTLDAVDLATGTLLQKLNLSSATITGLTRDGSTLYVMDSSDKLTVVDISTGLMVQDGSLILSHGGGRITVGTA